MGFLIWIREDWASLVAQTVKNHLQCRRPRFDPCVGKILWRRVRLPIQVFLPGKSPWTEEPGRLQSIGSQRIRHSWATKHSTAPVSVFWPRKFCKQGSLAGYSPRGHKESDTTEWLSMRTHTRAHTHTHVCVCNSIFNFLRNHHIVFLNGSPFYVFTYIEI